MSVKIRVNIHRDNVLKRSIINESICCLQYIEIMWYNYFEPSKIYKKL